MVPVPRVPQSRAQNRQVHSGASVAERWGRTEDAVQDLGYSLLDSLRRGLREACCVPGVAVPSSWESERLGLEIGIWVGI